MEQKKIEDDPLLMALCITVRQIILFEKTEDDLVHVLRVKTGQWMRRGAPTYTEVVLGLYRLLAWNDADPDLQADIWAVLQKAANHNFQAFVRLTNPQHNPNVASRKHAIEVLMNVVEGHTFGIWTRRGKQWQRGAERRLAQLRTSGALKVHGLE